MHSLHCAAPCNHYEITSATDHTLAPYLAQRLTCLDRGDTFAAGLMWVWGHGQVKVPLLERCSTVDIQLLLQSWPYQRLWRVL